MASPFDDLAARASRDVLSRLGESGVVMLRPRTRSEFAEGNDPSRPARQIRGVFKSTTTDERLAGQRSGDGFPGMTRVSMTVTEFWMPAAEVALVPYRIAKGDTVQFMGRPGSPVYVVTEARTNMTGDLNLILSTEGDE